MPAQTLRAIFAVSTFLTAFWVVGFALEAVLRRDPPVLVLLAAGVVVAGVVSWFAFRNSRLLVPKQMATGKVVRDFLLRALGAYSLSVPIVGITTWLLIRLFSANPDRPEVGTLVLLMSVWLPLWFAPAIGVEWSWRSLRKQVSHDL